MSRVMTSVAKRPGVLHLAPLRTLRSTSRETRLGTTEVEVVSDGGFEPGSGPARLVEHGGVGDLELGEGEGPLEAGRAVVGTEGIGDDGQHAGQESAQMTRAETGADAMGGVGVLGTAQPVVKGLEADAGLGQLTLGPLVPVGAAPQWVGRVGADLDEDRSPLGV